jgi:hypothetical protein
MCRYYFQIPWSSSFDKSLPIGSFIVTPILIDVNLLKKSGELRLERGDIDESAKID